MKVKLGKTQAALKSEYCFQSQSNAPYLLPLHPVL
jgi:hypothetical protein